MDVRLQTREQPVDLEILEDHHVVDEAKRVDQLGAIGGRKDRPPGALQSLHRCITIDRDDQAIRFGRGAAQIANVADVQQIEAAVRERNRAAGRAVARDGIDQRALGKNHLVSRIRRRPCSGPSCDQFSSSVS